MTTESGRPVVYVTSGIFGYLYRFLPIGRRLASRGRRVVVVSASAEALRHASAEGFDVVHLAGEAPARAALEPARWPPPLDRVLRFVPGMSLGPRGAARRYWRERAAIDEQPAELAGVLAQLAPSLVLTEAEEHRDLRVALAGGHDVLLFEDLYSTRPGPNVPFPARSHQIPTPTRRSRWRAAARWERFFAVEALRRRAEAMWVDGHDWHSSLARLAPAAGLGPGELSRRYLQFYDYPTLPRVRTIAASLALPGEPGVGKCSGPIVDLERRVREVDDDFEARWAVALARRGEGARLVYISLGTFLHGLRPLTEQVIAAAQQLGDVEIIVSVGKDIESWHTRPSAENVAVFGRVPQLEVLEHCDLVVATGGLNTGHEAIMFGVPILNLPVAGVDTPGNAARLAYHGVGRRLVPRQISVAALRREMALLLEDPSYRARAEARRDELRASDGVGAVVAAIEERLAGEPVSR